MRFGPVSLDRAEGKILGHHLTGPEGKRAFRKGKPLTAADIANLRRLGTNRVYVAELEKGDIEEDQAALRLARAILSKNLELSKPHYGRVNLRAERMGVLKVDPERLTMLNACDGITLATLTSGSVVHSREVTATVKIVPFAIPDSVLRRAEAIASDGESIISLNELIACRVSLILTGSQNARQRVIETFEPPLRSRIEALGAKVCSVEFITLETEEEEDRLVHTLLREKEQHTDLIILAGETAIMDRFDIAPLAVERAGGEVACFGAPVDPGNLLMLAYLGNVPILGAPGCARSLKRNIIDIVLPRLLAGEHLSQADIRGMGHGGLLEDTSLRPMPRDGF
jgi:molybdenum cofactor cytidylyltransferase